MRNDKLLVALYRTLRRSKMVNVIFGLQTVEMKIEAAAALVADDPNWKGQGRGHRLDAVVYDPPPKPDPEWEACWRNTHSACLWTEGHYTPHQA